MRSVCFLKNASAIGGSLAGASSSFSFLAFADGSSSSGPSLPGHGIGEPLAPQTIGSWSAALIPHPQPTQLQPKPSPAICGLGVHAFSASPVPESPSVSFHTVCSTRSLASGPDTKDNRTPHKLSIARAIPSRILREKVLFRLCSIVFVSWRSSENQAKVLRFLPS